MKSYTTMLLLLSALLATAQTQDWTLEKNAAFTGAKATKSQYRAIYQLDQNDAKVIENPPKY